MAAKVPAIREDGLQLEERRDFQERFWALERVAWLGFAILLVAALAGFSGSGGVLSRQTASVAGLEFEYPPVSRRQAVEDFRIFFIDEQARTIHLSGAFSEAFQLESVQPRPVTEKAVPDGLVMEFQGQPGGTAYLHAKPLNPGLVSFDIRAGGETGTVRILILP